MKPIESKRKLEDIMREFSSTLVDGVLVFKDAIFNLVDNKKEEFDKNTTQIIEYEDKADRLKEKLIEKFLKKETMAFSRSDRIQLIESIDIIMNNIEYCVRAIQTHSYLIKDYSPLSASLKNYITDLIKVVKTLSSAIDMAEENLEKTIEITNQVKIHREKARDEIFHIMKEIILSDYETSEKILLYMTIKYLLDILEKAEETSGYLRVLAIKYLVIR
jgi:uncharacterized protein Yka (UPF0111/DUF47 family)